MSGRFDRRRLPPASVFYQREIGRLTRPNRKGWALGRCPFHKSNSGRSFSVNVQTGSFTCFGCSVHGSDIVGFLMVRDGLSFPDAAKMLNAWDEDASPEEHRRRRAEARQRELARLEEQEYEARERALRHEVRDDLHNLEGIEREAAARLREFGLQSVDADREWAIMAAAHGLAREANAAYQLLAFGPASLRRAYVDNPFARPHLENLQLMGNA